MPILPGKISLLKKFIGGATTSLFHNKLYIADRNTRLIKFYIFSNFHFSKHYNSCIKFNILLNIHSIRLTIYFN